MHVPARPLGQPVADQRRLVGCVIVHDKMNLQIVGNSGFDLIERLAELRGAMAPIALADDPAGCDVEGGEERSVAMARVIVAASSWLTGPHRQYGLAAVAVRQIAARRAIRPSDPRRKGGAICRRSLHPVPALLLPPCSAGFPRAPAHPSTHRYCLRRLTPHHRRLQFKPLQIIKDRRYLLPPSHRRPHCLPPANLAQQGEPTM